MKIKATSGYKFGLGVQASGPAFTSSFRVKGLRFRVQGLGLGVLFLMAL